ncbi:MAG: cell division ATP-binding protein FtsE, partial [Candidatus Dojkabacteria bacterium]
MIQFIGVTKTYPAKPKPITALDEVSFEINPGEFVFLVGHSGSGKTTILRQIIREETPSKGRIFFNDDDITRLKRNGVYKLRRQIGTIFQDYKLVEDKTAYENVAFALEAAGANGKQVRETVPYVLDIVNLADRAESFPAELSGGEKQRVAIARAIVNNPKLLIADEPTGNLDPDSAWDVVQVLDKINKWGTTIIMSTHGTDIVDSLRKRVIKLEKGKLVR